MTNDEVWQHLQALGFVPCASDPASLERKLGPIALRASLSWPDARVSMHGSYRDARQLADTEGMLSLTVADMLMNPSGLLPRCPTAEDIADRIDVIFSELPDPPELARLRHAVVTGQVQEAREALSSCRVPASIKLGPNRSSLLHFAKSVEMVRLLSACGVDPNQPARCGTTPLFETDDLAMIDALFEAGASAAHRDRLGQTVLHQPRSAKVVRRMLEGHADPNAKDLAGNVPLHHCRELPALVCLLSAGAEINAQNQEGCSALLTNLEADRLALVALLLAHGADPERANAMGETAIFFSKSVAALQLLLHDYGANVHVRSGTGRSALHGCRDAECVTLLCNAGLPADARDVEGCTPLHLSRSVGVVRVLLERGAAIDAQDISGRTPLHRAVIRADHNVVVELLSRRASPNLTDVEGNTALHFARTSAIARRLLDAGGDPHRANFAGQVAARFPDTLVR